MPRPIVRRTGLSGDAPIKKTGASTISGNVQVDEYRIKSITIMRNGELFDRFNSPQILVPSDFGHELDFVILGHDPCFSGMTSHFQTNEKKSHWINPRSGPIAHFGQGHCVFWMP